MTKQTFSYSIIILISFTACVFFIRCFFHVLSGDELIYTFIWEPDDPTWLWDIGHRFEHKALDFSSILQTQIRHFHEANGRFFIHTIEQLFTDHLFLFSVVNTLIFIGFIWLTVWYVSGKLICKNYLLWLSVTLAILYLFPYQESLWTSVNYGLNYLWPATMTIGGIILWEKNSWKTTPKLMLVPITVFGILLGWSNEAFSVGFAGGLFVYYCFHFRSLKGQVLWFVLPLWLATTCMVFAPGNIKRFLLGSNEGESISLFYKILNGSDNFVQLKIIWIALLGLFILYSLHQKTKIKAFINHNLLIICIFGVTLLFCSIFHTQPYSCSFLELLSLLLILKYILHHPFKVNKYVIRGLSLMLTCLFFIHQSILGVDTINLYGQQSRMISNYITSPDGLVKLENTGISQLSKPYLRGGEASYWCNSTNVIHGVYGKWKKPPILLLPEDYEALSSAPVFFQNSNKCLGNAPVYHKHGGFYYWIDGTKFSESTSIYAELYPYDWKIDGPYYLKLKFALLPETTGRTEKVSIDTLHTRFGTAYRLSTPYSPQIKSFHTSRAK